MNEIGALLQVLFTLAFVPLSGKPDEEHATGQSPPQGEQPLGTTRRVVQGPLRQERGHYDVSSAPAVTGLGPELDALRITLYQETCSSWKVLVETRFRLLALLPPVSFALITGLFAAKDAHGASWPLAVTALAGSVVTLALFLFERRNSELHDFLISRARRLEWELGIQTGQFLGRPDAPTPWVRHDAALLLIYVATEALWLAAALALSV